jgi:hypothetical protein
MDEHNEDLDERLIFNIKWGINGDFHMMFPHFYFQDSDGFPGFLSGSHRL